MKLAKANDNDINAAFAIYQALDAIADRWCRSLPQAIRQDGEEEFDIDDHGHCRRVIEHLSDLTRSASLARFVMNGAVMLDPRNKFFDPAADTLEYHPHMQTISSAKTARPLADYHEDMGDVLWWIFPIEEPPYCGSPLDAAWPGYHTHWTPLIVPEQPAEGDE